MVFFGVGVGEGQVKWSLPDAHTDFIIAVAAEEYGFVLVALILFIYSSIVCVSIARLLRERDFFCPTRWNRVSLYVRHSSSY